MLDHTSKPLCGLYHKNKMILLQQFSPNKTLDEELFVKTFIELLIPYSTNISYIILIVIRTLILLTKLEFIVLWI